MSGLKVKIKTPGAVEKVNGQFRLKVDPRQADDAALLAKSNLKVDELAAVVNRLIERVKALEEG